MKRCRHFYVSGRVQGVFYRATACAVARRLGLTGWVCNLPDGRVEALACGEAEALHTFEGWLWEGPAHAHVDSVVAADAPAEDFTGFAVR